MEGEGQGECGEEDDDFFHSINSRGLQKVVKEQACSCFFLHQFDLDAYLLGIDLQPVSGLLHG
jgi:hypothetical protein